MAVKASATISIFNVDDGATGETGVGVDKLTAYYAVGASGTTKPSSPSTTGWSTTLPTVSETQYLWLAYLVTYTDGTTAWTEPYCVTDATTRERVTSLETDLRVVQGQITAKVWQSDITAVTDPLGTQVTTLEDNYSALNLTVDGIQTQVGSLQTTTDGLSDRMSVAESTIDQQADQISLKVDKDGVISEINQTAEAVKIQADKINLDGTVLVAGDNGTVTIADGSITAGKINVTDLFAQDITATGTIRGVTLVGTNADFDELSLHSDHWRLENGNGTFVISNQETSKTLGAATQTLPADNTQLLMQGYRAALRGDTIYLLGDVEIPAGLGGVADSYTGESLGWDGLSGNLSAGGSIVSGNQIGFSSGYNDRNAGLFAQWKDGSNHDLIVRGNDGLTAAVGWIGSSAYPTVLNLRGRTVNVVNSSGTSTLSDERMKKDWRGLDDYDSFFDALNPQAFRYVDGSSGRYHLGFGAQSVEQALADSGLDNADFGGLVKYAVDLQSEDWRGYSEEYGLIYSEFVALLVDQVQKLKARVETLEKGA